MKRFAIVTVLALAASLCAAAAFAQVDTTAAGIPDSSVALPPTPPPPPAATPLSPTAVLGPNSPTPARPHESRPRAEAVIRAEYDQMNAAAAGADADLLEAKKKLVEAKSTVEIKKKEIETLNARVKAAKQTKDETTRAAFEGERKRQESMRDYFEHAQNVAEAAIDEAAARGAWARAAMRADQAELQLVGRSGIATYDADPSVFKLEQQWFEAAKLRGQAQEKLANKLQTLMDKKLRVYRAWADFLGGK